MESASKKRKRKTCPKCKEEYTARHLSRHTCISNQETVAQPVQQTSSSLNADTNEQGTFVDIDVLQYSDSDTLDNDVCFDEFFSDSSDNEEELLFMDSLLEDNYSSDDQASDVAHDHYLGYFF